MSSIIKEIQISDPVEIVKSLEGREARVTLTYFSGAHVSGIVLRTATGRSGTTLLLGSTQNSGDVIFVRLDQVMAVEVHNYQNFAPVLTGGAVARSPSEAAPNRLELKRKIQAMSEELQKKFQNHFNIDVLWDKLPESEHDVMLNLRDLSEAIKSAVERVAADDLGRKALNEIRILRLSHTDDESPSVKRDGSVIDLIYNLKRALPARLGEEVNEQLNSVL